MDCPGGPKGRPGAHGELARRRAEAKQQLVQVILQLKRLAWGPLTCVLGVVVIGVTLIFPDLFQGNASRRSILFMALMAVGLAVTAVVILRSCLSAGTCPPWFLRSPAPGSGKSHGGLSIQGAIAGAALAAIWFTRSRRISLWDVRHGGACDAGPPQRRHSQHDRLIDGRSEEGGS
jgi:prolipoprotein diacylglyceryltransferase